MAHWALSRGSTDAVLGAFLVAPADVDGPGWPTEVEGFRPMPLASLPFPSVVIASRDDEWVTLERARHFARSWGSDFVDVGSKGHLDSDAELGIWPEGLQELTRFVDRVCGHTA